MLCHKMVFCFKFVNALSKVWKCFFRYKLHLQYAAIYADGLKPVEPDQL